MRDKLMAMSPNRRIFLLLSCFFVTGTLMFVYMEYWLLFFILMLSSLSLLISTNREYDRNQSMEFDELAEKVLIENNFKYDDFHIGDDKLSAIAINEQNKKLAIVHRKSIQEVFTFSPIEFSNVIESSIVEDGESISKVSKGSLVGGATIGSVIAGGIGATVGAIGADRISKNKVKKITLMIIVNDLKSPVYHVNFMNTIYPIDKETSLYKSRYSEVNRWHKMISVILKRNELNSNYV